MKIVDAEWETVGNKLIIECHCGRRFRHRSDRWRAVCPRCKAVRDLAKLREEYVEEVQGES